MSSHASELGTTVWKKHAFHIYIYVYVSLDNINPSVNRVSPASSRPTPPKLEQAPKNYSSITCTLVQGRCHCSNRGPKQQPPATSSWDFAAGGTSFGGYAGATGPPPPWSTTAADGGAPATPPPPWSTNGAHGSATRAPPPWSASGDYGNVTGPSPPFNTCDQNPANLFATSTLNRTRPTSNGVKHLKSQPY